MKRTSRTHWAGLKGLGASFALASAISISGCATAFEKPGVDSLETATQPPKGLVTDPSDAVRGVCATVEKLRAAWFGGATMEDFTDQIPVLAAQLATIDGSDPAGVIPVSKVLLQDLLLIDSSLEVAPTTTEENDTFIKAIEEFPVRSETIISLCPLN